MPIRKAKPDEFDETKRARTALEHTRTSVKNFYASFEGIRKARDAKGAPTDGEQDLVRAAVVFAAGGLDVVVKEVIRGSLKRLTDLDRNVQHEFEKFAQRQLRSESTVDSTVDPSKFLAKILVSSSPYDTLIESYIFDLTGSSLQSTDELFKAASALDLDHQFLRDNKKDLNLAFKVRNSIIHELDVDFDSVGVGKRQRRSRTKTKLKEHPDLLVSVADSFVDAVEDKLRALT